MRRLMIIWTVSVVLVSIPGFARGETAAMSKPTNTPPSPAQLHLQLSKLHAFIAGADAYIHDAHVAVEGFHAYVIQTRKLLVACDAGAKPKAMLGRLYPEQVLDGFLSLCRNQLDMFKQRARALAEHIDLVVTKVKTVANARAVAYRQVERIRLMLMAYRLKARIQARFKAIENATQTLEPQ